MGKSRFGKTLAGGSGTQDGNLQGKGSPGVKMSPVFGGLGKGIFRGGAKGVMTRKPDAANEKDGGKVYLDNTWRGWGGKSRKRMAGSIGSVTTQPYTGQKTGKEECD